VTLIELMVVVIIVAMLASIAVPGYRHHVLRTHRTEAKRVLLDVAAAQEKHYLQHDTYAGASELTTAPPSGLGIPLTTASGRYAVAIIEGSVKTYSATATAQADQANDTRCTTFAIDQSGSRTATNADCWE
jgi:type IV pilus assembly protein PilE